MTTKEIIRVVLISAAVSVVATLLTFGALRSAQGATVPASGGVRLPDGTVIDQPGASVTITTTTGPTPGGVTKSSTQAKGPGVTAGDGGNIKDMSLAVPNLTTTEDGAAVAAEGGESGFSFRAVTRSSAGVLYVGGMIAVLAGVGIGAVMGKWQWGVYLIAVGVGFILTGIVAESYPWLPLVVVAVAACAGIWLLVRRIKNNGVSAEDYDKLRRALHALVTAISTAPPEAKAAVKVKMSEIEKLDPSVSLTIAEVKVPTPS